MKTTRFLLAVSLTTLALAANSTLAHDTTKGAGKLLELSRSVSTRTLADASSKPLSTGSRKTGDAIAKGATKQLELSGTRVWADRGAPAILTTRQTTGAKPTGIVKGAARLVELTRGSRDPQFRLAPLK